MLSFRQSEERTTRNLIMMRFFLILRQNDMVFIINIVNNPKINSFLNPK